MMSLALRLGSSGPSHIHRKWLPWDVDGSEECQADLADEDKNTTEKETMQPDISIHAMTTENKKETTVDCRMAPITEDCRVVGGDDCCCICCIDDDDAYPDFF